MVVSRTLSAFFQDTEGNKISGLSASVIIFNVTGGVRTQVGTFSMTEFTTGVYAYTFAAFDTKKEYIFMFDGGASLDSMNRYKIAGVDGNAETETQLDSVLSRIDEITATSSIITQAL